MKVKGNIQSLQSSLDFCIKITSTGSIRSVDGLRKHFFGLFLSEEREQMLDMLEEKKSQKKYSEEEPINLKERNEEQSQEDIDSPFTSSFFLKQVQLKTEEESQKMHEAEDNNEYVSHGVYLEDIELESIEANKEVQKEVSSEVEPEVLQEKFSIPQGYIEHGVMLDDIEIGIDLDEAEGICDTASDLYVEHGIYLEDVKDIVVPSVFPDEVEEESLGFDKQNFKEEQDFKEERVSSPISKEVYKDEVVDLEEQYIQTDEPEVRLEITKDEEPTDAPKEIRDFLRQHPNASIDFVSKFYSKKEIAKQVKLGRIYKKNGKLMI